MEWTIFDSGMALAEKNMQIDQDLLDELDPADPPILHLYDWKQDAATYGYFLKPSTLLNLEAVKEKKLDLARRPTGGGLVFHITDLAFSVLIPAYHPQFSINTLENYALINRAVIATVNQLKHPCLPNYELLPNEPIPLDSSSTHFCMAKPTKYDVVLNGKKIGGAAQRRTKQGFLHQGTVSVALLPQSYLSEILLGGTRVLEAMQMNSDSLLGEDWTPKQLHEARLEVRRLLCKYLTEQIT